MHKSKTIAICNQKGGVGKTTTTVNLGVGLARAWTGTSDCGVQYHSRHDFNHYDSIRFRR